MLTIEWKDAAAAILLKLSPSVAARIVLRVEWMAEHFAEARAEALSGPFAGLLKLRVGDYRVVYEVDRARSVLVVRHVGHRSAIYR